MLNKNRDNKIYLLKGILLGFIITIVLILVFSILMMLTSLRETSIPLLNNIAMIFSIAISSIYAANKIKDKGWLHGGLVGLGYYLVLIVLNLIFVRPFLLDLISGTRLILATVTGVIGGMIGINLS